MNTHPFYTGTYYGHECYVQTETERHKIIRGASAQDLQHILDAQDRVPLRPSSRAMINKRLARFLKKQPAPGQEKI